MNLRLALAAVAVFVVAGCGGGNDAKRATAPREEPAPAVRTAPIQMSCREALKDPKVPEEIKRHIRQMEDDAPDASCGTYGVP